MIAPPLMVTMNEDGTVGFNLRPKTATDKAILVGILQQAVLVMAGMPLEPVQKIVTATVVPNMGSGR